MFFSEYLTYLFVGAALISVMCYPFVYMTINTTISLNHSFKLQKWAKTLSFLLKYSDIVYTNIQDR